MRNAGGANTFANIFQKLCLRTVFICAQKCIISFAHNFNATFARMFLNLFLGQLLVFNYIFYTKKV